MKTGKRTPSGAIGRGVGRASRVFLLLMVAVLVLSGCDWLRPSPTSTPVPLIPGRVTPSGGGAGGGVVTVGEGARPGLGGQPREEEEMGIEFTLSEGADQPTPPLRNPVAKGSPLSPAEVQALLDRLPPLEGETGDVQPFRFPVASLPAPRPGQTIEQPFPPPSPVERSEEPPAGPLKVLRFSPEGDVPLAPYLSVTFDQPMVLLTGHSNLAQQQVPVLLDPLPEGR
ncbi:MAG: hypothetical protein H5T69_05100, partial [Chloroflexi bacterium]|nr:hypothetical protein [Chloroflexota bacterium]